VKSVNVSTIESDGSEVTNVALPGFPKGLFVAMSNGKIFHYYSWEDFVGTK
jgi:3-phytase